MEISNQRVEDDASMVFDVIMSGGVAIVPLDVAYAIIGHTETAIRKNILCKKTKS